MLAERQESHWRILFGGAKTAAEQMAYDAALAHEPIPTVRFFSWQRPAISLGWKQPWPDWVKAGGSAVAVVERPTGGGIAIHGSDLSVAVIVPRAAGIPLDALMSIVCRSAVRLCQQQGVDAAPVLEMPATKRITYCLTETSPYAVMAGAKKTAGFALRRYPSTWLIQGSLLVRPIPRALANAMPPHDRRQFEARAVPLARAAATPLHEKEMAQCWAGHWSLWWDEEMMTRMLEDDAAETAHTRIQRSKVLSV